VPNARVTVENGAEDTTAFDGSVLFWLDTALMIARCASPSSSGLSRR